jgi:thioredoxin 1
LDETGFLYLRKKMRFHFLSIVLLVFTGCFAQKQSNELEPALFKSTWEKSKDAFLLDVRTPEEYAKGAITFSRNIDYRSEGFDAEVEKLDKKKTYFVYCLSGGRSGQAAEQMRNAGFKNVTELKGGILAWQKAGFPLEVKAGSVKTQGMDDAAYLQMIKSDKIVLIDFYAPWCGPCRRMEPLLKEVSEFYKGKATIIRINIDEHPEIAKKQKIDEIPFFKYYVNGEEKGNYIGELNRETFDRLLGAKP